MKLLYARTTDRLPEGARFVNGRFFAQPDPEATEVYLDGDYPEIQAAYEEKGVPVTRLDNVAPAVDPDAPPAENYPASEVITIPANWRYLAWNTPDERGLTLRGVAASVSSEPIRSKDDAVEAIEAYLAGGADQSGEGEQTLDGQGEGEQ